MRVCGFVGSWCQVIYEKLNLLILWKCYAVHINASSVAPLNVKTTLNVKTAKCEKPNNR